MESPQIRCRERRRFFEGNSIITNLTFELLHIIQTKMEGIFELSLVNFQKNEIKSKGSNISCMSSKLASSRSVLVAGE